MRNSTSKVKVETEIKELQDENRSLNNYLEGAYNRIKELQEDKVNIQHQFADIQIEKESLEHELQKTIANEKSLRDKLNNMNVQKLRETNELLLNEKNEIVREVEEKRMLIASNNQKLVEYGIEIDTLKRKCDALNKEKNSMDNQIVALVKLNETLNQKIAAYNVEADLAYKKIVEEKNMLVKELDEASIMYF